MLDPTKAESTMPWDSGVEQFVLGSVLLSNTLYARVCDLIQSDHFFDPFHGKVWEIIAKLVETGHVATPKTIKRFLAHEQDVRGQTIGEYLAHLVAEGGGTIASIMEHARILRDLYLRRRLIGLAQELADQCFNVDVGHPIHKILDSYEEEMTTLRPKLKPGEREFFTFEDAAGAAVQAASDAFAYDERVIGLSTGLHNIDSSLGGLQKSDLIVIAGRPGMGKTALATNIAFNVSRSLAETSSRKGVVAFFSLEMSSQQVASRVLAERSRVEGWKVRRGKASEAELVEFIDGARTLKDLPLLIDDRPRPTIGQITTRARALHKKFGLELVIVDYLQLMRGHEARERNRVQEVTEITGGLKALAKELECPVLALSQLSRSLEGRDDRRPQLSDLRESGSIEQDADSVLMIYRESYYITREEPPPGTQAHFDWEFSMEQAQGRADIIIAKNRHGPLATVPLGWDAKITQFHNDVPERQESPKRAERAPKEEPAPKIRTPGGMTVYKILRRFTHTLGQPPSEDQCAADDTVDPKARLVLASKVREQYGREVYNDDIEEKSLRTEFRRAVADVARARKLRYTGQGEEAFIWLPEFTK